MDATNLPTTEYQPTVADLAELEEALAPTPPTDEELCRWHAEEQAAVDVEGKRAA